MNSEKVFLKDIVEFNPSYNLDKGKEYKYVEMAAIPEWVKEIDYYEMKEYKGGSRFKNEDTLFARITPCLENGKTAQVNILENGEVGFGSTEFIVLRPKNTEIDKEFVYYFCRNPEFRAFAQARMEGTSGRQRVSWQSLEEYDLPLPAESTRKEIGDFLKIFDQKIHLNQQTNETLEAMAQSIFKSWFVNFDPVRAKIEAASADRDPNRAAMAAIAAIAGISVNNDWDEIEAALDQKLARMSEAQQQQLTRTAQLFPDELVESEIGEVPKGWGIKPFKKICEDIQSGGTPKRSETEYWGEGFSWLSSGEIRNRYLLKSEEEITEKGLAESNAKLWPSGSTIIAMYGATAGVTAFLAKEMCANQACCCLIPNKNSAFVFISALRASRELSGKSTGSAQQNLNKGIIERHKVLVPGNELIEEFEKISSISIEKIISNEEQNDSLSELRDTLLPKLISGEIPVN